MYRILIVEDDPMIAGALTQHFASWGMEARAVQDFRRVMEAFEQYDPHLVMLDIALPFCDGYYWCRQIRERSKVPILFISSADDQMSLIMAINMGGDDFVAKPFDLAVLQAKVQALLRRAYDFTMPPDTYCYGGLTLNLGDATLSYGDDRFELTKNEFRILQVLLEQHGHTVSRERLMQHLWATDCFVDENTLTVNMTRLRKKLAEHGITELIATRKGVGYLIP